MEARNITITINCNEFNIADTLRDLANFIEETDLMIDDIKECEGDDYTATLNIK